jgi:GINS complex subunit 3
MLQVSGITPESSKSFVTMLQPDVFSAAMINALKSDPVNVDLNARCTVFTSLAERWITLFDDQELSEVLVSTLQQRALEVYDFAQTQGRVTDNEFIQKLDDFEASCKSW